MTRTFCDRCGKEIIKSQYAWLRHRTIYAVLRLHSISQKEGWEDYEQYICPACEDEFIHWYMKGKKNTSGRQ